MLIVVLDTNAVHRDPWLTRDVAPKLIQLAASEVCEIVYPQVVIKELTRQRIESAREALDSAAAGVEQMGAAGINVAETVTLLQNAHDRIESDIDNAFVEVLAKPGVRDVPVPEVKTTDLLGRDLGRRRPFLEIEQGKTRKSLGFRDVLIWESVLEVLQTSNSGDTVLFVTFDGGFIADDKKSLHADLLEDLDGFGIPRERIRLARGGSGSHLPHRGPRGRYGFSAFGSRARNNVPPHGRPTTRRAKDPRSQRAPLRPTSRSFPQ
ncbi:PIN domain-containing protein [Curtobacterium sp. MCPF17_052]|uniref:PIN domain-containing protein n=1 Tax=Curtobacterium sp. MCPF17_052 TaxID=2175655 RepID=UPI0024DF61E3|nr:PIN domain-containing protein [Curtobacterium sp. MCPF17_052]WIB12573.1 PIN domain-containing protein [Curtobacterium sp. MCPF17_052]